MKQTIEDYYEDIKEHLTSFTCAKTEKQKAAIELIFYTGVSAALCVFAKSGTSTIAESLDKAHEKHEKMFSTKGLLK